MKKKMLIRETNEIKDLEQVGENLWLDEEKSELYNTSDLMPVQEHEISASDLLKHLKAVKETMDEDNARICAMMRHQIAVETIKKRPYITRKRLEKRIDEVMEAVMNKK